MADTVVTAAGIVAAVVITKYGVAVAVAVVAPIVAWLSLLLGLSLVSPSWWLLLLPL